MINCLDSLVTSIYDNLHYVYQFSKAQQKFGYQVLI